MKDVLPEHQKYLLEHRQACLPADRLPPMAAFSAAKRFDLPWNPLTIVPPQKGKGDCLRVG